jgi:predicted dehydrogenase
LAPLLSSVDRVLILGFGYAGRRFAQALRHLEDDERGTAKLAAICDVAAPARDAATHIATPVFDCLERAMEAVHPTVVVVTVNEEAHAEVLHGLAPYRPRAILCEKPLTATLAEAETLPAEITEAALRVNFVERQSPVLTDYFEWAGSASPRPLRVEFFWGKHRIADPRPTMGVLSEMTHPIDLIDHLFGFEAFEVVDAHGVASDYSPHCDEALDTVSLVARADDYAVLGHSSFTWPRRHRILTALLIDHANTLFRVTLDFDSPRWDCDRLTLERIDRRTGRVETILERATDNTMFPVALFGVAKVASFVRASLREPHAALSHHELVDYRQALKIQRVLDLLSTALERGSVTRFDVLAGPCTDTRAAAADRTTRPPKTREDLVPEEDLV